MVPAKVSAQIGDGELHAAVVMLDGGGADEGERQDQGEQGRSLQVADDQQEAGGQEGEGERARRRAFVACRSVTSRMAAAPTQRRIAVMAITYQL
ncbi:MAG: hypothetical protein P0Y66_17655 [Candidatus Kaistia colombiensis]|nr:MAG: hypothetical protein P0Y66_17655 [Kaistia sp.]